MANTYSEPNLLSFSVKHGVNIERISSTECKWNQSRNDGCCTSNRPIKKGDAYKVCIQGRGHVLVGLIGQKLTKENILKGQLPKKSAGNWVSVRIKNETECIIVKCVDKKMISMYPSDQSPSTTYDIGIDSKSSHFLFVSIQYGEIKVTLKKTDDPRASKKKEEDLVWCEPCGYNVSINPNWTTLTERYLNPFARCAVDQCLKKDVTVSIKILESFGKWHYLTVALSNTPPEEVQLDSVHTCFEGTSDGTAAWPRGVQPCLKFKCPKTELLLRWNGEDLIFYNEDGVNDKVFPKHYIINRSKRIYLYLEPFRQRIAINSCHRMPKDYKCASLSSSGYLSPVQVASIQDQTVPKYTDQKSNTVECKELETRTEIRGINSKTTKSAPDESKTNYVTAFTPSPTNSNESLNVIDHFTNSTSTVNGAASQHMEKYMQNTQTNFIKKENSVSEVKFSDQSSANNIIEQVFDAKKERVKKENYELRPQNGEEVNIGVLQSPHKTFQHIATQTMPQDVTISSENLNPVLTAMLLRTPQDPCENESSLGISLAQSSVPVQEQSLPFSDMVPQISANTVQLKDNPEHPSKVQNKQQTSVNPKTIAQDFSFPSKVSFDDLKNSSKIQTKKHTSSNPISFAQASSIPFPALITRAQSKDTSKIKNNERNSVDQIVPLTSGVVPNHLQVSQEKKHFTFPGHVNLSAKQHRPLNELRNEIISETKWRKTLQKNHVFLIDKLEPQPVAEKLYEKFVITDVHLEIILAKTVRRDKCRALLDKLNLLPHSKTHLIIQSLQETEQQHIVDKLLK